MKEGWHALWNGEFSDASFRPVIPPPHPDLDPDKDKVPAGAGAGH